MGYQQGHLWNGPVPVSRICPDSEELEQIPQRLVEGRGREAVLLSAYVPLPACAGGSLSCGAEQLGQTLTLWGIASHASSQRKQEAAGQLGEVPMTPNCQLFGVRTHQPACTKSHISTSTLQVVFIFSFGLSAAFFPRFSLQPQELGTSLRPEPSSWWLELRLCVQWLSWIMETETHASWALAVG